MVIGNSAAGKSTLAHQLSEKLQIPVYHLDVLAHKPNTAWERILMDDFVRKHDEILKNDEWIIEGNFINTFSRRLDKVDIIIFLSINRFNSAYRYIKRCFSNRARYGHPKGNSDIFSWSQFKYILFGFPKKKRQYEKILKRGNYRVIKITSFNDLVLFKKKLGLETNF